MNKELFLGGSPLKMLSIFFVAVFFIIGVCWLNSESLMPKEIVGFRQGNGVRIVNVTIHKSKDGYVWSSNDSKPLQKFTGKTLKPIPKTKTFFINPNGEGVIVIEHDKTRIDGSLQSDFLSFNIVEYKISKDGKVRIQHSSTEKRPFPGRNWRTLFNI